ncbi:hypothetical protein [Candidatus Poriferisodalis sp.]|uniref:hypothetical protein n=1 Tax=Candidatus Poriferisodalis sp. TaxID=3101277 RepID=UPI003B025793
MTVPDAAAYRQTLNEVAATTDLSARIAEAVATYDLTRYPLPGGEEYDSDGFRESVVFSITTLRLVSRRTRNGASAHWWARQAEALSSEFGGCRYISNVAMLVAAYIEGIHIFEFVVDRFGLRCSLDVGPIAGWQFK